MLTDTTREAARIRIETLRELGASVRLKQALDLSDVVRRLAEQGQRDRDNRKAGVPRVEPA
jgi:hypothetical protein